MRSPANPNPHQAEPGLTPRVCWFLFDRMAALAATAARQQATRKFRVLVTHLQIEP